MFHQFNPNWEKGDSLTAAHQYLPSKWIISVSVISILASSAEVNIYMCVNRPRKNLPPPTLRSQFKTDFKNWTCPLMNTACGSAPLLIKHSHQVTNAEALKQLRSVAVRRFKKNEGRPTAQSQLRHSVTLKTKTRDYDPAVCLCCHCLFLRISVLAADKSSLHSLLQQ